MKNITSIISVLVLLTLFSCEKKESLNKLPEAPVLIAPANGTVTGTDTVVFKWSKSYDSEGDNILYTLFVYTDSSRSNQDIVKFINDKQEFILTNLEKGQKYYWEVKAENYFEGNMPEVEDGQSISNTFYFYSTPLGVSALHDSSGHEFINLYWKDPENLDYVEISFEPKVAAIAQPIKVYAGIEKLELKNFENGTIYSFYVTAYNKLGHKSEPDTIRSLPLIPIQVHDIDFNIYNAVTIGTQTWLRENLRATRFQDGSYFVDGYGHIIPPSNFIGSNSDIYGLYYYAEFASGGYNLDKNPCPCGYHVPTDLEWKVLESYLGMTDEDLNSEDYNLYRGENENVVNLLKSVNGWSDYNGKNGNGSDFYSFNLLPAGRIYDNTLIDQGKMSIIWSSTQKGSINTARLFSNESSGIRRIPSGGAIRASIRCIKN